MPKGLATKTVALIDAAYDVALIRNPISVRGVAYQLFNLRLIPDMSKRSTDRVSRALTIARERGLIPWEWIVDEHREIERPATWDDPTQYLQMVQDSYRRDRWTMQPSRVLVMSEKGTVGGILRPVLAEYGVPFLVAHGFGSATVLYNLAGESVRDERPLTILYVGDYDSSGRYMSDNDLPQRLERYGGQAEIVRVALTKKHLAGLPSFAAASKQRDARHRWYVERFGDRCWELDALDPNDLRDDVANAILNDLDLDIWNHAGVVEDAEVTSLREFFNGHPLFSGRTKNRDEAA